MYVGSHAEVYICLYIAKFTCRETCMIMYFCVHAYMYVCAYAKKLLYIISKVKYIPCVDVNFC